MRNQDDEKYAKFESELVKLYFDVFGDVLTEWVMPTLSLNSDMELMEDILVPEGQLTHHTMGLVSWADTHLKVTLAEQRNQED